MLISILRNLGKAQIGLKNELEVLIEEQKKILKKSANLLICRVNFKENRFELQPEQYDETRIMEYLPGITKGSSKNYSPLISLKTQKDKNKEFHSVTPDSIITWSKILGYENYFENFESPVYIFGSWLNSNYQEIAKQVYLYFEKNYLEENKKGQLVVKKTAPKFLLFQININNQDFYVGQLEDFRTLYIKIKINSQQDKSNLKSILSDVKCLACGNPSDEMIPLSKCKFYELFSLDQISFSIGFQDSDLQGMICKECENFLREGYNIANSVLRFNAYQIQTGINKGKRIEHFILPLADSNTQITQFVDHIGNYRKEIYSSKQASLRKKIQGLSEELEKADIKRKAILKKEIKEENSNLKKLEEKDFIEISKSEDILNVLKQAVARKIGIIDVYFEEIRGTTSKKVIYDIILSDYNRLKQIIEWLQETDQEYPAFKKYFSFGNLINIFGEKMGKRILQSLFTNGTITAQDFYHAAYDILWLLFRNDIKNKDLKWGEKFFLRFGPNIMLYTIQLLQKVNILVGV